MLEKARLFYSLEMTLRFETATMVGQRCILQYLEPWLENIELVDISSKDINSPTSSIDSDIGDAIGEMDHLLTPINLQGEGWGSVQASFIVLNNLFYLTVKV